MGTMFHHRGGEKVAALYSLLQARGLEVRDFELREEAHSGVSQLLGMVGGILTVRRRSSGELRVYACGPGSAWYAAIMADLDRGYFHAQAGARAVPRTRLSLAAAWRGLSPPFNREAGG